MLHKGVIGMSGLHYLRAYLTAHDGKSTRTSNRGTPACWERLRAIPWKKKIQVCLGWGVEFLQAARHSCRQLPRMGEFLEKELEFNTAPGAQSVCLSSGISPRAHVSFRSWGSAHWQPSCTGAECTRVQSGKSERCLRSHPQWMET